MATIDSQEVIKTLLENNGHYMYDPVPVSIYEYTAPGGKTTWSVCYFDRDEMNLFSSPYVVNPVCIWHRDTGLQLTESIADYFRRVRP